jgi:hypothetical protein
MRREVEEERGERRRMGKGSKRRRDYNGDWRGGRAEKRRGKGGQ